jgi:hypothetical protein
MKPHTAWKPAVFSLALALLPTPPAHAASGPFAALAGTWAGSGTVAMANGGSEPLRCQARYAVGQSGENLRLNIRCASDSYRFDLAGNVASQGSAISGQWSESSRNATGTVRGQANGNRIVAVATGDAFSASLSLTTRGSHQTVSIQPHGTEVQMVSLRLNRR